MKFIRVITASILVLMMLSSLIGAAGFTSSPEKDATVKFAVTIDEEGNHVIGKIYDSDGEFERNILFEELIITTLWHLENGDIEVHNAIEQTLVDAKNELSIENWADLIPGFEEAWKEITEGAPVENAVISDIFDVRYNSVVDGFLTKLLVEGKSATFDIVVDGVTKDTYFIIGHKPSDTDEWTIEDYQMNDNNTITISVDSLSPFFIAVDNGEGPGSDDDPQSPQTGVSDDIITVAVIFAVVLCAAGLFLIKKYRKVTDQ